MDNLFNTLPEDIQLKIIKMNPHPVAEIMKRFYNTIDCYDYTPINRQLWENKNGEHTIEMFRIVNKHKYMNTYHMFLGKNGDTYVIANAQQYFMDRLNFRFFHSDEYEIL